jgi:hypothetical protein
MRLACHGGFVQLQAGGVLRTQQLVEQPQTEAELEALRRSVARGRPFGNDRGAQRTAKRFGLEAPFRPQGRPRKEPAP